MVKLFIVLDGIDGSGKGEVLKRLVDHFSKTLKVVKTEEPTQGIYGKEIRQLLKEKDPLNNKDKLLDLYIKDRGQHVNNVISPFLKNGSGLLLCDRYYYSTIVYQSAQGILGQEVVIKNSGFPKPHICFILDLTAEKALDRITQRNRGLEKFEKIGFLKRIREGFLRLSNILNDDNIKIIDASKGKEEVFEAIKKEIEKLI
ncbi:MAG: dTMP kinase [Nanoarchaeota archaeon]